MKPWNFDFGPRDRGDRGGRRGGGRHGGGERDGGGGGFGGFGGRFGRRGPGGPGWEHMFERHRARRGNVRTAILSVLGDAPQNGYQIMQAIEQRSNGSWKPSSGSVYPTLQLLEDEGLIAVEDARAGEGSSRTYKLTSKGKKHIEEHRAEIDEEWATFRESPGSPMEMFSLVGQIGAAAAQVARTGTAAQLEEARKMLNELRRKLYGLLAEDPDDE